MLAYVRSRPGLLGAAWLFLAVNVANLLAYVYQVVMLRLLTPAEFSLLVALFAALIIEAQGMQLLQGAAAKIVADRSALGDEDAIVSFVRGWARRIAAVAAVPAAAVLVTTPLIAPRFGFPPSTVAMLGASILFAALFAFGAGVLQGLGRFVSLGVLLVSQAGARLAFGVALVLAGLGVVGAFGAAAAAIAFSFLVAAFALRRLLARSATAPVPEVARFFVGAAIVFLFYAALVNVDAILAPLLLDPQEAGVYAAAVTLGKIALFAPLGLSYFLLERTARAHALGIPTRPNLYKVLGAVGLVSGPVAIVYLAAPDVASRIVAGEAYVEPLRAILGAYGVVALSNALLNVWIAYFVGIGRLRVGAVYVAALVGLVLALALTARDPETMVRTVLATTLLAQLVTVIVFLRTSARPGGQSVAG